jgi:hypothetical protein
VLGIEGLHAAMPTEKLLPGDLLDLARALAPFAVHPSDLPLAKIEIALPKF